MTCRYKRGDTVVLKRASRGGLEHGLGGLIRAGQQCRVYHVDSTANNIGEYRMTGTYAREWYELGSVGFYWYDTMCDPMWNFGDILLRTVRRDGQSDEYGIPEAEYDQMDLAQIAARVLGFAPPVTGTKSCIDTPDCTILTIGPYQS